MFFAKEDNVKILAIFLRKAESAYTKDDVYTKRISISKEIIGYIYKSPNDWDKRCSFNIKHIGDQFLESLRDFNPDQKSSIDNIYVMAYRFLCEFDFLVGTNQELNRELGTIKSTIQNEIENIGDDIKSQIIYASFVMPANIAKEFINDGNIGVFKDFETKKSEAEKLKLDWATEIKEKEVSVNILKNKLDNYKTAFNFVGLYDGFSSLAEKKGKEASWLFLSLIAMGILILAPLAIEIIFLVKGNFDSNTIGLSHFIMLLPLISIEVILIYFFRIILINHKSVKAQIMQIELRQTMCQFIQNYTEFSSDIKKEDSQALDKFENLIFSGILSDSENLPSTFDGMEQISSLIKSFKKG